MSPRAAFALAVALAFADWIVREDRRSAAGIEHAAVERIPGVLVAAVAVDDDQRRQLAAVRLRPIENGGHAESKLRLVGDPLGNDPGRGLECAVRLGLNRRDRIGDEESGADLSPPQTHLICCGMFRQAGCLLSWSEDWAEYQ